MKELEKMANEKVSKEREIDKLITLIEESYYCDIVSLAEDLVSKGVTVQECGEWVHPKGYVVSNGFLCSKCGHEQSSYRPINPRSGGVCGCRHEQSEMIRTDNSPNGWLCVGCWIDNTDPEWEEA